MKLTKQEREVVIKGVTESHFVMASPSGRWGMYRDAKSGKITVAHLPTGQTARRDLTQRMARVLIEALEDISTPTIDALPFGAHGTTREEKDELIPVLRRIQAMVHEGTIR